MAEARVTLDPVRLQVPTEDPTALPAGSISSIVENVL
ncbi:hypothetical protein M2280_005759 [Prescottella agglutinans]|jgi:hypothetical protein|uniref:Uncharacterized protein n=1 Tax=Prescottella agglutinans TaxID=1644129 RepID=A0ABT6MM08_9NOCA|nr:hypothetical protein [Prescottella agglutinans]